MPNQDEPFQYDLYLGVIFVMRDRDRRVICRVTKAALDDRAARSGRFLTPVEAFQRYRSKIEAVASAQYDRGVESPLIESEDLVPIRIAPAGARRAAVFAPGVSDVGR